MANSIELPSGFVLDKSDTNLPEGFTLDQPNTALDIAKGVGASLADIPENALAAPPMILRALGGLADKTGLFSPEAAAKQEELRNLIQGSRTTMADIVPQPEGRLGKLAQSATAFAVPAAGLRGNIARNVGIGAAAGLGSEAAGQATEGTSAELPARIAGALAGGYAGARGAEAIVNKIGRAVTPSGAQIGKEADALYSSAREEAVGIKVGEGVLDETAAKTRAALNENPNFREVASPEVHGIINKIGAGASNDVGDLVAARKALRDSLGGSEGAAAKQALGVIEGKIEQLAPGVMRKIRDADQNYRAFMTDLELNKKITKAEMQTAGTHSGMNLGNKLRQQATNAATSTKAERFYTPETIKALGELNKGTLTQNLQRYVSKILGGGGGLGALHAAGFSGGAAYALGEPGIALAPLAGLLLAKNYNRLVANQAQKTAAMIRAQSPLAQRMALERTSKLLPTYSSPGQYYNNPNYSRLAAMLPTGPQFRKGAAETGLLAAILSSPGARSLLGQ